MSRTTSPIKAKHHIHPNNVLINRMIAHRQHSMPCASSEELKELKQMSRKLRQLKRQMFLKHVEDSREPSPVDCFRSLIRDLAIEEEAREALRMRSNSVSSHRTASFDDTMGRGDSLGSIQE